MVFCDNCGKRFAYKEKFCTSCGTELRDLSEITRGVGEIIKNEYRKQLSNPEYKEIQAEFAEYNNKPTQAASNELNPYWQIIDSLRAELAQYKSQFDAMIAERARQNSVDLLREEVAQYKRKFDAMIAERSRQNNVDLPRKEMTEFENSWPRTLPSGDAANKRIIHSLGADIEKLRKNLELVMVEAEKNFNDNRKVKNPTV